VTPSGVNVSSDPQLTTGKRIVFAAITLVLLLGLIEVVLRMTGAAETCSSQYANLDVWACDPILGFKLNPKKLVSDDLPINRAGFRTTNEFGPKNPAVYRVLALGDSCTFGIITRQIFEYIPVPYPQRLEQLVLENEGPGKVEVLNAGVPGYNSSHGLMLMRTKLRRLQPDLVTVRFGWNDHFMGKEVRAGGEPVNVIARGLQDLLLRTSLYPFVRRLDLEVQAWRAPKHRPTLADIPKEWKPIVPMDEYKRNLRRIAEIARARGAEVWFLTAPHAFLTDENRGQYDKFPNAASARALLAFNAIPTFDRLIEIHESYAAATREVGADIGVPIVDMEQLYREHASEHLYSSYDVPHPTQEGHDLEAQALFDRLVAKGIVKPEPPRPLSALDRVSGS